MKLLASIAIVSVLLSGCTFTGRGSQALTFDPFQIGKGVQAIRPADGFGYVNGEALDQRR